MNARLHLRWQRFHFYKQSINNSQQRNRHYAAGTLHKRKISHKPKCNYAVITHHAKYAKATQAHASLASIPTMDQSTKKQLSQQKVGKKDNSCLQLGCNSTLFSPSQPRLHQGSYPYVDCCLLLSQPNDALTPSVQLSSDRPSSTVERSLDPLAVWSRPSLDPPVA